MAYNRVLENTTHGLSRHPLYHTWILMKRRCENPKDSRYITHGARGITVCERWQSVSNFIEDMYPSYIAGLTLDRRDNDGNYEPFNCRWATYETQVHNRRVLFKNNTSGYKGVYWQTQKSKWRAMIGLSGKRKHIGLFNTALEAAHAYDQYVIDNGLEHKRNF